MHKKASPFTIWQLQEAKAKFSEVVEKASSQGYQAITKNGVLVAVLVSKKDFDEMTQPKTSLVDFFKSSPFPELDLPVERSKELPRDLDL